MKTVAVLTSGGDAPGMNAAIRSVVRYARYFNYEVFGIKNGYSGLLDRDMIKLHSRDVSEKLDKGGTFLKTARCKEFMTSEGVEKGAIILNDAQIDSLVVIGGDGSFRGAKALHDRGIKTIAIPGTIDNDLGYTDYTIGFDTAITTVMEAVSKLRDTSSSHSRVFVVQVMGRNCGDIALHAGVISGAEEVIIPEVDFDIDEIAANIKKGMARGKSHYIILMAEGSGNPFKFTKKLEEKSGIHTRLSVIGYLQRGGSPTSFDRMIATRMGARAIELLEEGESGIALGIKGNEIINMDIENAIKYRDKVDMEIYNLAGVLAR